jgi:hypothetical protein
MSLIKRIILFIIDFPWNLLAVRDMKRANAKEKRRASRSQSA